MMEEVYMTTKRILLFILSGYALFTAMTICSSNVLGSDIESYGQISFQMPEYIPIEQQSINNIETERMVLINGPIASGKYDRQFGYVSNRKEVIPAITQLPSVGVTYMQSLLYILCSVIIITMIIISEKMRKEKGKNYD